jgi:hypothetical protein
MEIIDTPYALVCDKHPDTGKPCVMYRLGTSPKELWDMAKEGEFGYTVAELKKMRFRAIKIGITKL